MANVVFSKFVVFVLFCLFLCNCSEVYGAEAPGSDSEEQLLDSSFPYYENLEEFFIQLHEHIQNFHEVNLILESAIFEASIYITLIMRLVALTNPKEAANSFLIFHSTFISLSLNSSFDNKQELILSQNLKKLRKLSKSSNLELRSKIKLYLDQNSVKLFDLIFENKESVLTEISLVTSKIMFLLGCNINTFLKHMGIFVISILDENKKSLNKFFQAYSKLSRSEVSKNFIANKDKMSEISLSFCYDKLEEEIAQQDASSPGSDIQQVEEEGASLESLYTLKVLLLTSFSIFKISMYIFFFFNIQEFHSKIPIIKESELLVRKAFSHINGGDLSEESRLEKKLMIRNMLNYDKIQSLNIVSQSYVTVLEKEDIIKYLKELYKVLLEILNVLRKEYASVTSDPYRGLFELTVSICEKVSIDCLTQIKKINSFDQDQLKNSQLSLLKVRLKVSEESLKIREKEILRLNRMVEKDRRKKEQEAKKILQETEKKRVEEERKKAQENKKKKKKTKIKRVFPTVESTYEVTSSGTGETSGASQVSEAGETSGTSQVSGAEGGSEDVTVTLATGVRVLSQSELATTHYGSCRPKHKRKEDKIKKLLKDEEKSQLREEIKKTIQSQKSSNLPSKKQKQIERKSKNDEKRKKEENDREREREAERKIKKEKQEKMEHSNFMYSLTNSISSLEGLFLESGKARSELSALIAFVFQVLSEEVCELEKTEVNVTAEALSLLSVSETGENDVASSTQRQRSRSRSGSRLSRRSSKSRSSSRSRSRSAFASTALSGESGSFYSQDTRDGFSSTRMSRSKSRSRSRSRSRRKSRSGSRSRSESLRTPGASFPEGGTLSFDGFTVPGILFEDQQGKSSCENSKFLKFFSTTHQEKVSRKDGDEHYQQYSYLLQSLNEFSLINESSTNEEINMTIESCGVLIQNLHIEVVPGKRGPELMYIKLIEKLLIKEFIRLLILIQSRS